MLDKLRGVCYDFPAETDVFVKTGGREQAVSAGDKKAYNNTFETLIAIWNVLMEHSSKEHPLSVAQIVELLKRNTDAIGAPSANSVRRYLSGEKEAFDTICSTHVLCEENTPMIEHAYSHAGKLHLVLENREGLKSWEGDASAVFEAAPAIVPRYSTIANLLATYPTDAEGSGETSLPPVSLKCVVTRSGKSGKKTYIPYQTWADGYENDEDRPRNKTRYYYLESVLSKAEWKILADAVKVYPYITDRQTKALLGRIRKLNPGRESARYTWDGGYYAYKRSRNDAFFDIISKAETAISQRRAVIVTYGSYVLEKQNDGTWEPALKKRENKHDPDFGTWRIEPYELMWSNGYYYLVGKNTGRGMMNLRVDRILSLVIIQGEEAVFQKDLSFDPYQYRDKSPVMYPGESRHVHLRCREDMVNVLLDFFGPQAEFCAPKGGYTNVRLDIAPGGVKLFVMQYADRVEVLEPQDLRDEVRDLLKKALEAYQ